MSAIKPIATPKKSKPKSEARDSLRAASDRPYRGVIKVYAGLAKGVTGAQHESRADMLAKVRQGLPFSALTMLERTLHATRKEMASVLSITSSTLSRRKSDGRLHVDESDRVVRIAQLYDATVSMMIGDEDAARAWLRAPLEVLGNETPLDHASTELGARDVEDLIGRIRYGVFS